MLSRKIINQSLEALLLQEAELSPSAKELIRRVNLKLAEANCSLAFQSDPVLELLFKRVNELQFSTDVDGTANEIVADIHEALAVESKLLQTQHHQQGQYSQLRLHRRSLRDQLQDHDITMFMPKSEGNIEVLAPVHRLSNISSTLEGLKEALANTVIEHIFMPIGPGHWRGFYLSKPKALNEKYTLELFDPYGPNNARAIQPYAEEILRACNLNPSDVNIQFTGPLVPQSDGYACGDFTCAYSHKKKNQLGNVGHYNAALVQVLDEKGNKVDQLRKAFQDFSLKLETQQPVGDLFHQVGDEAPSQALKLKELEARSTRQEQKIYRATIKFFDKQSNSTAYKLELATLLSEHKAIQEKADAAIRKEEAGQALTDEEHAAKLQADEFQSAGFKH
ncbi:hypothetical protein [Legionella yabuuchiae]|uniref:hypothetical protein n=1 Tax=Legionella yabuuchiae TaxID=376727 RepID=UPI001054282C|nr:hypothetical protein [Legionella yabuuchiae]